MVQADMALQTQTGRGRRTSQLGLLALRIPQDHPNTVE